MSSPEGQDLNPMKPNEPGLDESVITSVFADEVVTRALVRDVELPYGAGTMALISLDNGLDHTRPSTFGPAGLISLEDGAIGEFVQKAIRGASERTTVIEMGGREVGPSPNTRTTETSVRGFWRTYRTFMNI